MCENSTHSTLRKVGFRPIGVAANAVRLIEPSRKRHRSAILASTAAMAQRSGSALPVVLPRGVSSRAALALALRMSPFGQAFKLDFPTDTHRRVRFTNELPKLTKCLRRQVILRLRKLSNLMCPARLRLTRLLQSKKAPARTLNKPLIMLLVDKLDFPDKQLPRDLAYGMRIVGGKWKRPIPSLLRRSRPRPTSKLWLLT